MSAFLVQDYVAADSLDSIVREYGPAPVGNALRVATQLASALDFAAAVYVTHGALHPRDVLVSSDETRLTGLGVARALERIGVTAPVRRPYTAPERMAGGEWDRRADVFSLAALTHELLWGRRVSGLGQQAANSLTAIDGVNLDALRDVFTRALAELPADRYGTALEFVEALRIACPDIAVADEPAPGPKQQAAAREIEPRLPLDPPSLGAQPDELRRGGFAEERSVEHAAVDVLPAAAATPAPRKRRVKTEPPAPPSAPATPEPELVEAPVIPLPLSVAQDLGPADPSPLAPPSLAFDPGELRRESPEITDEPVPEIRREPVPDEPRTAVPAGLITGHDPDALSAFEVTRTAVWPLVLALGVGIAIGFAAGFFTGTRDQSAPAPAAVAASAPAVPAPPVKEFTESTVAPKPAPPEAAPAPAAPKGELGPVNAAPGTATEARRTPGAVSPTAADGRLLVRTRPAGARVSVDGKERGVTPAAIRDLANGPHRLRITHDGYVTDERRVVISASRPSQSMTIALVRARGAAPAPAAPAAGFAGALSVDSRPTGAKVFMDGKLVGTTPMALPSVPAGSHAIQLEHDGYRRWSSSVRVVANEQNRVTASLER